MRENIENIEKQIEKIKEIAYGNKETLEVDMKDLTEAEIEAIRETQKTSEKIQQYNFFKEYEKYKRFHFIIRMLYIIILTFILVGIGFITSDYITVKLQNQNVQKIIAQNKNFEKKNLTLQSDLENSIQKNESYQKLIKQKDEQIATLKSQLTQNKKNEGFTDSSFSGTNNFEKNEKNIPKNTENNTSTGQENQGIENNQIDTEKIEKKCITTTTITINIRDKAGLEAKILGVLNEGTEIEVLSFQNLNDRTWYEVMNSETTGRISSIGIENFDVTCLKK